MKRTAIIHVDALRRDYLGCWLLRASLIEKNYTVILTSRRSIGILLRLLTPQVLILSHVFTIPQEYLHRLALLGTKIYVNEVEGVIGSENVIATTYPEDFAHYDKLAGIFVWSEWSHDWLVKNRKITSDLIHVTGSIRNNGIYKKSKSMSKPIIGFLSRFEIINTFDNRHNFNNLSLIDPQDDRNRWYFERCAGDSEAFSIFCKITEILVSKGFKVCLRPHPNENIKNYDFLKRRFGNCFSVDASIDINEWIDKVSLIIGPASTAYLEPYFSDVPVISTNAVQRFKATSAEQKTVLDEFLRSSHNPDSVAEIVSLAINRSLTVKYDENVVDYFERFYSIKSKPNAVFQITNIVVENDELLSRDSVKNLSRTRIFCFYVFAEIYVLLRTLFNRNPRTSLRELLIYDYNMFLHWPSPFFKRLLSINK